MSAGGPGQREVAHRIFAVEFDESTATYVAGDDERSPNYVVSPSGACLNRVFVVGTVTESEWVNDETLRARVVDPTGPFIIYASQYQQEARAKLDDISPPAFVAVTGKANTFQPEGRDRVYTSIRPEAIARVDTAVRDRWAIETARQTLVRLGKLAAAIKDPETASRGPSLSLEEYGTTPAYVVTLYERCLEVLELIAGDRDSVSEGSIDPAMAGDPDIDMDAVIALGLELSGEDPTASERVAGRPSPSTAEPADSQDETASSATETPTAPDEDTELATDEPDSQPPERPSDAPSEEEPQPSPDSEPVGADPTPEPDEPTDEGGSTPVEAPEPPTGGDGQEDDLPDPEAVPEEVLSNEEREAVESEFGTDFTTGDEIDPPTPEAGPADEPGDGSDPDVDDVVALLRELDPGDGVDRERIITRLVEEFSLGEQDASDLLQSALLEGRCYQVGDDVIRPI